MSMGAKSRNLRSFKVGRARVCEWGDEAEEAKDLGGDAPTETLSQSALVLAPGPATVLGAVLARGRYLSHQRAH